MGGADNKGAIVIDDNLTPPQKPKAKVKSSAATVHGGINEHLLLRLDKSWQKVLTKFWGLVMTMTKSPLVANANYWLYEKQAALEKSILFYQKFPDNAKTQEAMQTAMDKHLKLTEEIQDCLDRDGEGDGDGRN
jgi:hypothetical protein